MMKLYKSYVFRTKDPAIDELRTVFRDHFGNGKLGEAQFRQVEEAGGPTTGTMRNWFFGKTQRPQSASLEAAGRAIGYKRVWVKANRRK